ncbi:uncharacterized protein [Spinacia oleracea]|uniref:Uncharacterized protein isoform X2 n=1 Tax=Spinacia oleracea TaxID=3562 RepID=A0ABM3QSY0_SPIOL|nr:uncharacterized protein LOC110798173 isoform X2 [Spinacia oleracea]
MRHLQEIRSFDLYIDDFTASQKALFEELFQEGDLVDVSGTTIGKGFQVACRSRRPAEKCRSTRRFIFFDITSFVSTSLTSWKNPRAIICKTPFVREGTRSDNQQQHQTCRKTKTSSSWWCKPLATKGQEFVINEVYLGITLSI